VVAGNPKCSGFSISTGRTRQHFTQKPNSSPKLYQVRNNVLVSIILVLLQTFPWAIRAGNYSQQLEKSSSPVTILLAIAFNHSVNNIFGLAERHACMDFKSNGVETMATHSPSLDSLANALLTLCGRSRCDLILQRSTQGLCPLGYPDFSRFGRAEEPEDTILFYRK